MCFYVKSLLRDPRPPRRVSVSLFASRFSPLGPCAKDSKRAFAARRTGVASAKRVSQRSRSEKRPGTVMLSTSSRSRHNLPILYVYTLFLSNAILSSFVTFRFVCMCVFLFFFRASIFPSKSLAGAPRASPSNDSVIFPLVCSHARRTCSRLSRDRPCQRRE